MAKILDPRAQYVRLLDGSGNALTSTSGELDVNVSITADSMLVYGYDGSSNQKIATDASGNLQIDVLSLNDGGNSVTVDASALDIRALTNSDVVTVENAGTFAVQVDQMPVTSTAVWSAASTGAGGKSGKLTITYHKQVTFYGNVSGATTLTMEVSDDNSTWYSSGVSYTASGSEDIYLNNTCAANYVRLSSSNDVTATVIGSAKN